MLALLMSARGIYDVNRTLGPEAVPVAVEAYFGFKLLTLDFLGGGMAGNRFLAVGDFAACTVR